MKRTILVADNQSSIRQFCKQELEASGYRVILAEDGEDAFDVMDTFAVDLVVLDEHMPRCSGLEAAGRAKESYPNLPVILFTADQDYERFKSPLIDAAVIKSEDLSALKEAIAELLTSHRADPTVFGRTAGFGPSWNGTGSLSTRIAT